MHKLLKAVKHVQKDLNNDIEENNSAGELTPHMKKDFELINVGLNLGLTRINQILDDYEKRKSKKQYEFVVYEVVVNENGQDEKELFRSEASNLAIEFRDIKDHSNYSHKIHNTHLDIRYEEKIIK